MDIKRSSTVQKMQSREELLWINEKYVGAEEGLKGGKLTVEDILDAKGRLERFAPFIQKVFPETADRDGIIESDLREIGKMEDCLRKKHQSSLRGRLFLKMDSHLPIAGSVKARGGIYEVLKHSEELAFENGLLKESDSYECLAEKRFKDFFEGYTIQVGSTGNLGLSIGIMSAVIGYKVIVHMSSDAKEWKKQLLRSYGVKVVEYEDDYSEAVIQGRRLSDQDPNSYFVDDENSVNLFLGYAVAAERLKGQLDEQGICVDEDHPLFVYLPCGVGGAPGGVTFGLKHIFGDYVNCFFVEPVDSPCMLLGMETGLHEKISVKDIGLSGQTQADGLAVGRPSGFVGKVMEPVLSGVFTVKDPILFDFMRDLLAAEEIFIEPSACAAFAGPSRLEDSAAGDAYLKKHGLKDKMDQAVHIAWATGGKLVPEETRRFYENFFPTEQES